ncbi:MAG: hypothetical protein ABJB66_19770, partial [Gemmatimonadaceae bacterium]
MQCNRIQTVMLACLVAGIARVWCGRGKRAGEASATATSTSTSAVWLAPRCAVSHPLELAQPARVRVGDDVDWGQVESKTLAAAAGAQSITDAYPAIRVALVEIHDPWAMYRSATGQTVAADQPRCVRTNTTAPTVPAD